MWDRPIAPPLHDPPHRQHHGDYRRSNRYHEQHDGHHLATDRAFRVRDRPGWKNAQPGSRGPSTTARAADPRTATKQAKVQTPHVASELRTSGKQSKHEEQQPSQQEQQQQQQQQPLQQSIQQTAQDSPPQQEHGQQQPDHQQPDHQQEPQPPPGRQPEQQQSSSQNEFALLERFLAKQKELEAQLLPTAMNVSTVHLQCGDVLNFIAVQQWVAANLGLQLQLLEGIFVTVQSADLLQQQHQQQQPAISNGNGSSTAALPELQRGPAAAVASAVPRRLRQVVRVEVPGPLEPADQAKVMLAGGGVVPAGRLGQEPLTEVEDHEDLCRELAALQLAGAAPPLRLYDLAHTVWRLRLCAEVEHSINICNQEQADLAAEGYDDEMLQATAQQACNRMRDRVHMLPKPAYVSEIMSYVELISDGPAAHKQHQELAAAEWQVFVQRKLVRVKEQQQQQPGAAPASLPQPPGLQPSPPPQSIWQKSAPPGLEASAAPQQQQQQQQDDQLQNSAGHRPSQDGFFNPTTATHLDLDDHGFFDDPLLDDPTGSVAPQASSVTRVLPAQGSLGFGMGSGAVSGTGQGENPNQRARGIGTRSSSNALAAALAPAPAPAPAAAATAIADDASAGVGANGSDYLFWVKRGDISAAQNDPRTRRILQLMESRRGPGGGVQVRGPAPAEWSVRSRSEQQEAMAAVVGAAAAATISGSGSPRGPRQLGVRGMLGVQRSPRGTGPQVFGGAGRERMHPAAGRDVTGYGTNSLDRHSSGVSGGEYGQPAAEAAQGLAGRPGWQSHEAGRYRSGEPNRDRRGDSGDQQRRTYNSAWQPAAGHAQSRSGDSGAAGAASGRAASASRDLHSPRHSRGRGGDSGVDRFEGRLAVGRDSQGQQGDRAAGLFKSAASSGNWDVRVKEGKCHRTEGCTWGRYHQDHPREEEDDHHKGDRKGAPSNKRQRSSRARDRSRSMDRDRDRDRDKSQKRRSRSLSSSSSDSLGADRAARKKQRLNRSRSPQQARGAKDVAAMVTDAADLRGPAVLSSSALDTVRRRFAGRLEGADRIFGSLSTEAIILEWLRAFKQLKDSRHGQRHFTDGMCQLWFLRQELPIPQEAIEAYGSVFAFLGSCPAVVFNKFRKVVGLRDEVDVESFSLPARAPPADESAWQNSLERRGRYEASEMDSGLGNEVRNGSAAAGGAAGSGSSLAAQHSGPGRNSRDDHDSVQDDWEPDSRSRSSRHRSPGHSGRRVPAGSGDPPAAVSRRPSGRHQELSSTGPESQAAPVRGRNGIGDRLYSHHVRANLDHVVAAADDDDVAAAGATDSGDGAGPLRLSATDVDRLVRSFTDAVLGALTNAPRHYLEHSHAESLLPAKLHSRVQRGAQVDLAKLVSDHIPQLEVVPCNGRLVVQEVPCREQRRRVRRCAYWDPSKWTGCNKAAHCRFRHDLSGPGAL